MNVSDDNLVKNHQSSMSRSTDGKSDIRYDADFSRIEELIKGSSFTREEIRHLVEILNSSVDDEQGKQKSNVNIGDTQLVSCTHEIERTPSQVKQQHIDRTMIGTFHQNSDVPVGVSASPIDIARAYMAGRTSDGGLDLSNMTSKFKRDQPNNEFARKQFLPSPSPKPSICWPGAMVPDRHGFATPLSQSGRHRLHNFPRTPYSRTTLGKSTTKVQAESGYPYTSTPVQQSQASFYGQVKSRDDTVDGYGSVGPIRRIRNKFAPAVRPRGFIFRSSPKETPSNMATPKVTPKNFGGFLPGTENSLEPGEASGASKYWSGDNASGSSYRGISNPHASSSHAVRKILEHLDRNEPTPKEKEGELKLATSWRRSSSETGDTILEENISSVHVGELHFHKNTNTGQNIPEEFNKSSSKSNFSVNLNDEKGVDGAKDAVNGNAKASNSVSAGFSIIPGRNAMPSFGLKGTSGPMVKNLNENAFAAATNHGQNQTRLQFSCPQPSDGQTVKMVAGPTGSDLSKNHEMKPSLPSISISKPDFRAVSSNNGPGFTFPVSASSGALSELPTPSITPPTSASILSQPAVSTAMVPSYSFGTNKSTPSLVFSFPSTNSAPVGAYSDLKFSFGSDKKTRLSFSSFGKDAICC